MLCNRQLSYFKSHQSVEPIRVINLGEAREVDYDRSPEGELLKVRGRGS